MNLFDCWVRNLPLKQVVEVTGESTEKIIRQFNQYDNELAEHYRKEEFTVVSEQVHGFWIEYYKCTDCRRKAEHKWNVLHKINCPREKVDKELPADHWVYKYI